MLGSSILVRSIANCVCVNQTIDTEEQIKLYLHIFIHLFLEFKKKRGNAKNYFFLSFVLKNFDLFQIINKCNLTIVNSSFKICYIKHYL